MPQVTSGGAGWISWNPNPEPEKPEPVSDEQLQKSMEHYTKLRERLLAIKTVNDLPPQDVNSAINNEVIDIASEALSAVFFYMGAAFATEKKLPPPSEKPIQWTDDQRENLKLCKGWVSSHQMHRDYQAKKAQPISGKNYAHILEVAKKATELASELLAASNPYNVIELADELSTDKDFIESFRDTHEMRLQRAYDAINFVQWWAWWKDGVQYVGTTGTTLKEAQEEICRCFEVTVSGVAEAHVRLQYHGPMPF